MSETHATKTTEETTAERIIALVIEDMESGTAPLSLISEEEWCAYGYPYAFAEECATLGYPYGITPAPKTDADLPRR